MKLKERLKQNKHLLLVLLLPAYLVWFFLLEKAIGPDCDYWVSYIPLDDYIPFCEWFVIPYVLWYPFMAIVGMVALFKDVPAFKRYMWYWFSTFAISLIICMVFPNGQDLRPTEFARDNVLVDIVKILYASDTNTNVLPSMHVVGSIAAAVCVFDCKALKSVFYKIGAVVLAALISISTVFIKQHSALDIFASIVVCIPTYLFIYKGGYDKLSAWIKRRRNKNKKA